MDRQECLSYLLSGSKDGQTGMSVLLATWFKRWTDRNVCPTCYLVQKMDRQECLSLLPGSKNGQTGMSVLRVINNLSETFGLEARASNQCAVNVSLRHQARNVFGLDRATVKNSQVTRCLLRVSIRENAPDKRVHFLRLLRRRCMSGTNGPNRLVGN